MHLQSSSKIPHGQLGIIALKSCNGLGERIDKHIVELRKDNFSNEDSFYLDELKDSYLIPSQCIRFSNGEGKVILDETVRGKDVYILSDVGNYNCTYDMFGMTNHMGPDEHFQDIKRAISAVGGKARRITVIMPLLYASRQHKRKGRESLDCSIALQELERLGVQDIITFDAHDPRVENCIPRIGFDNLNSTYKIIKSIVENEVDLTIDKSKMMVISPDTGGMDRAIYYANVLGIDVGLFYKRRDYTRVVNGKNPIVQHEYIGADVAGKDVLIVDDMIASGESIIDIAKQLKKRNTRNIYIAATFAMFTEGISNFEECYKNGSIKRIYSTNLTYVPEEAKQTEWYHEVDMSDVLANVINKLNYDDSIAHLYDATEGINKLLSR